MTTTVDPAVHDLLNALCAPIAQGATYWLCVTPLGRHSLIAPVDGVLVWLHLVPRAAVDHAETAGLITCGPLVPLPPYRYGGRWPYEPGMHGRTIALTSA